MGLLPPFGGFVDCAVALLIIVVVIPIVPIAMAITTTAIVFV